jgi:Tat protein translocase TatB subunit
MFGIGMQEIIVILVLALIVIGPKKLPEVAKALGKGYGEFRRAFEDMRTSINADINSDTRQADEKERLQELSERIPPPLQKKSRENPDSPYDDTGGDPSSETAPSELPAHEPVEEEVEEEPVDRA